MLTEKSKKLADAISNSLQRINSSKNVRYINQSNYDQLGTFHKMFLTNIGKMLRVVDKDGELEYEAFVKIVSNMFDTKSDLEKQYIWGLFFPDTIKTATFLNPFPVPVFSYKQQFTFHITPNNKGNFLLQMVVPCLYDKVNGDPSNLSDVWVNTSNTLDGYDTTTAPGNWRPVKESLIAAGVFQAYLLCAASIKVAYTGRVDVSSGYFGASYHLTNANTNIYDPSTQDFNYVDNSFGSVKGKLFSGVEVLFFPQDSSFQTFKTPNSNSSANFVAMSHRMNVYGRGLPIDTLSGNSVVVNITKVYAMLPTPGFDDILGSNKEVNQLSQNQMDQAHDFIRQSGLASHELTDRSSIEKLLELAPVEQNEILTKTKNSGSTDIREFRTNLIDNVKTYIPPQLKIKLPGL